MKIAILGTRGIPNSYGGFEQFAEYLSVGLVKLGHQVTVYNTSFHEYQGDNYKGVVIKKIYSPEKWMGASANFIYDFLCLKDALKQNFDIIYELGYHSNAPSYYLLKKESPPIVTNMDGMEWKRSKWGFVTRLLIRKLEKIAVKRSDHIISDNLAIKKYYLSEFDKDSVCIPYGADLVDMFDPDVLTDYGLASKKYYLLIARLEPENNIEMILDGFMLSDSICPCVIIGNFDTPYGRLLRKKYQSVKILFLGAIYNKPVLDTLRYNASIYFHGHSVGGTNPSLLEAMASMAFIAAHDNLFNRAVLGEDAFFFSDLSEVSRIIQSINPQEYPFVQKNVDKIKKHYSWDKIILDYEKLFLQISDSSKKRAC